jgi:hypothetical protein
VNRADRAAKRESFVLAAGALCILGLAGCAGVMRLPASQRGSTGDTIQKNELDLTFLEENKTRREEVFARLSSIDTEFSSPNLFWGRWSDSKWGYWWFVTDLTHNSASDAKRMWHVHNLLVTFDENGLLQKKQVIDEDSILWRELRAQLTKASPLDFSTPREISVGGCCRLTSMTLSQHSIKFDSVKAGRVEIAPLSVIRISHDGVPNKRSGASWTCHTLHLVDKSPFGKNICFCANAAAVATTFQYLQQTGRAHLQWE